MSPVWMLMLFQSVILRLTETESTSRVGSLAHFCTLNHQNHQNQLWRFADVTSSLLPFSGHLNIPGPPHSIESSLSSISVCSTSSDIVRHHKFDLTKCPAASIQTTYHSAL